MNPAAHLPPARAIPAIALLALTVSLRAEVVARAEHRETPGTGAAVCNPKPSASIADELKALALRGVPDCPPVGAPHQKPDPSKPLTLTDTGLTRCRLTSTGEVVECPHGLTLHIETKPCQLAPCDRCPPTAAGTVIVGWACRVHYL